MRKISSPKNIKPFQKGKWRVEVMTLDGINLATLNFTINPDQSISVDVSRQKTEALYQTELKVLWNLFF